MKSKEQLESETVMYGCTQEDLENMLHIGHHTDTKMLALSILSDTQEEIERGNKELARMFINRAKFLIMQLKGY
jgi:hypothetical protein